MQVIGIRACGYSYSRFLTRADDNVADNILGQIVASNKGVEESGKVITVNVGDTIKVLLPSNPTTGYGWQFFIENGKDKVTVLKDDFIPPKYDGRVGVGGEHIYELRATNVGNAKIAGYYYRPWEGLDKDKDTNVIYEIVIQ